jgi:hypothetical protein
MSKFTLLALLAAVTFSFGAATAFAGEDCGGCCKDKPKKETKEEKPKDGAKTEGTKTN